MNLLFLRGQEPQDRDPRETYFNDINKCDDLYTLICYEISKRNNNHVEVLYWDGQRKHFFSNNLVEKRVPDLKKYEPSFNPDVIFARGGFKEYDPLLRKFPNAFKIYYGAHAIRFNPIYGSSDPRQFSLVLVDSHKQQRECKKHQLNAKLWIKPAAESIIKPYPDVKKEYDIVYPANGKQKKFKGHQFVFSTVPKRYKILNLGNDSGLSKPSNITSYRVTRSNIAKEYAKAKIGIICCNKGLDSCPRVLPEMLCCNIPVVVMDTFYFWKSKYINEYFTGMLASKESFWKKVDYVLNRYELYKPRKYYYENLSIKKSVNHLMNMINKEQ